MSKKRILITVKTYPTISVDYFDEIVCTAGFDEEGNWVRIFPVPFRKLDYKSQYKKYQWIEMDLVKNTSDFRPESFRPKDIDSQNLITIQEKVGTENNWLARKNIVLKNVYYDMSELIEDAKSETKYTSLAVFKPTKITNFVVRPALREWNNKQKAALLQQNIFKESSKFDVVRKLPYKFSYVFYDIHGNESTLMNEDWELGALFWKCMQKYNGDENAAIADVKKKYLDDFAQTKDIYFFLGTTKIHHLKAKNPFIIIGTFYPNKEPQMRLKF